jgi:hypothetical protein
VHLKETDQVHPIKEGPDEGRHQEKCHQRKFEDFVPSLATGTPRGNGDFASHHNFTSRLLLRVMEEFFIG